jgi:hypothetical protein
MNRLIADKQKNAFSIIAKALRDSNIPVRTKKQLQQYVGTNTFQEALDVMIEGYNNDILMKREKAKKAKAKAVAEAKKQKVELFIPKGDNVEQEFFNILKKKEGKTVNIDLISDDKTESFNVDIPEKFNSWWKANGIWILRLGSDEVKWNSPDYPNLKVYIYEGKKISPKKIVQYFKDGSVNCVLKPIIAWATNLYNEAKSKSTKSRYNTILKHIEEFKISIGTKGVNDKMLQDISEKLQIDISVEKPLPTKEEPYLVEVKSSKKALKHFIFRNVRIDHVELNEFMYMNDIEYVERDELLKIKKNLDKKGIYYTFSKDMTNYSKISTIEKTWTLKNDFNELVQEFEKEQGLDKCYIDDVNDKNLTEFIRSGCHYNATIDFTEPNGEINHQDMKNAYIQYKECDQYEGFLGKITDFRECNKIEGVGLYQIKDIVFHDKEFAQMNEKLDVYKDGVFPSPELKYLQQYATFTIVAGCWGVESLDVDMTHDFLKEKYDGVKGYAKYVGKCDSHHLRRKFWCKGDEVLASIIRENSNGQVDSYFNNEICLSYPKQHNYHLSHFTAFITSYQRIQMIKQLLTMNYDNLVRICVDGIYYKGEETFNFPFFKKDVLNFGNEAGTSYISWYDGSFEVASKRAHNKNEIHIGAGGNGKTHLNLTDKGLIRVLYVAPSHKLASKKRDEYKMRCEVWANLLSSDPEKYGLIQRYNNVLVIDECSMMTEIEKQIIINRYSDMKIIFCGDLGYQASPFTDVEMNMEGLKVIEYEKNYRFTCNKMIELMKKVRLMIKQNKSDFEVNKFVFSQIQNIDDNELKSIYKIEDMILSRSHLIKDRYTEMFKEMQKWYVTKNTRLFHNGDIVIGDKPDATCEVRHSYTIHSIQGETAHNRLFINMDNIYDKRLLYTALSRAREISQIYLVKN